MEMQTITASRTLSSAGQFGSRYVKRPTKAEDGEIIGTTVQTIRSEPQVLYQLWRDITLIPRWQENVVSVTPISEKVSHWIMGNPEDEDGKRIEFDSEITEDVPGGSIAWKSITEGVKLNGRVSFQLAGSGRGTLVTLVQSMEVPGGSLGNAAAAVVKRNPRQSIVEDLRHFKQLAETGEIPTVVGQPHGPRGVSGGIKEWLYGENNPTPPGTSNL